MCEHGLERLNADTRPEDVPREFFATPLDTVPTTTIKAAGITYVVTLSKRTGMKTQESYDAEVKRITTMLREQGVEFTLETKGPQH